MAGELTIGNKFLHVERLPLRLERNITQKELDVLKHFIRLESTKTLHKVPLEKCSTFVEVWEELKRQNIIWPGDYELLKKALKAIGRRDLVMVIEEHESIEEHQRIEYEHERLMTEAYTPTMSSLRRSAMKDLLLHLRSKITQKELDELKKLITFTSTKTLNLFHVLTCSTFEEVWQKLESQNLIRLGDYELLRLKKALGVIGRPDLVVVIEEHEQSIEEHEQSIEEHEQSIEEHEMLGWLYTSFREKLAKEDGERSKDTIPPKMELAKLPGLHWGGHIDLARERMDRGADINIKDRQADSPFHLAIKGGHINHARELMDRGAAISIKDRQGDRPLCLKDDKGTNHGQRQDKQLVKSYRMTFSLDQPFKEDLKDEESEAYKELEQEILDKLLRKAFGDDFKKISVLKFEEGSIKVNLVIELTGDKDIEELEEKLRKVEEEAHKMMQFRKSTLIFEVLTVNSDDTSENTQEPAIGNIHGMHIEGDLTVRQDITINKINPLEHHWKKRCSIL